MVSVSAEDIAELDIAELDIEVDIISFKINIFDYIVKYVYSFV